MAIDSYELKESFEKWLLATLKGYNEELDESIVSYLSSIVGDEDTADDEKVESVEPILQELNQHGSFEENQLAKTIVETWNQKKAEFNESDTVSKELNASKEPDALDTISDMLKKHELKTEVKKTTTSSSGMVADYGNDDDGNGEGEDGGSFNLAPNTNGANVLAAQKAKKDNIAAAHAKQKEQTKKAAEDQKKKEEERKKKAKEKATKVERRK